MIRLLLAAAIGVAAVAETGPAVASSSPAQAAVASDLSRFNELLARALGAPAVQQAARDLDEATRAAMQRLDPAVTERRARAQALQAEATAAQEAGDAARLNRLAQEADELRAYFQDLSGRASEDPAVTAALQRHEDALMAHMTELDPEAPELWERIRAAAGR